MSVAPNINKSITHQTVLVAPLDWGLGHTTRCIPIIRALQAQHNKVLLAAEGNSAMLLQQEFPDLTILPLKGYRIQYAATRWGFFWKMLLQAPSIMRTIRQEKNWLQKTMQSQRIDWVISDNRFGLTHSAVKSVFITHQLAIRTGWKMLDRIIQHCNYYFINQFTECWVPDHAGEDNLSGSLSHPISMPAIPVKYVGPVSRMEPTPVDACEGLICMVSGPEPQRTIFEKLLVQKLHHFSEPAILVRGLPANAAPIELLPPTVVQYNHVSTKELNQFILRSKWVIARAGYSTIMDLCALQKKAVIIPTPGQTEQEYLAAYLHDAKRFYSVSQNEFQMTTNLKALLTFKKE